VPLGAAGPAGRIHTATTPEYRDGSTRVLSYRDYFDRYRHHPESKALDPTDGERCHPWTRGYLRPSRVTTSEHLRVGKESNRLKETHRPVDAGSRSSSNPCKAANAENATPSSAASGSGAQRRVGSDTHALPVQRDPSSRRLATGISL
jgi:hypothetical protein